VSYEGDLRDFHLSSKWQFKLRFAVPSLLAIFYKTFLC